MQTVSMRLMQVNLVVEDFPRMVRFYGEQLGFDTIDIDPGPPAKPMENWASFDAGGVVLEIFDVGTYGDREPLRSSNREAVQICFIVTDVASERERLVANGVECDEVITEEWGSFAGFPDPEGNRLQIYEVFDKSP